MKKRRRFFCGLKKTDKQVHSRRTKNKACIITHIYIKEKEENKKEGKEMQERERERETAKKKKVR